MDPDVFFRGIVVPSLQKMETWTGKQSDGRALALVMAIAGQESDWKDRRQIGGPARSYWQFEWGGGVLGLLQAASPHLQKVCAELDVPFTGGTIFEAMAWNDTLACCMARLLLWSDPRALPEVGDQNTAWHYYLDNWRPGRPRPDAWHARYGTALLLLAR